MNYLAHTYLSGNHPLEMMGNTWGDLLRPKDYPTLHPDLLKGIKRHKLIDAFTDQHAGVHFIIDLIRPYQGKYTPVVVDVLMDYMLSKYWKRFCNESIEDYCADKYKLVQEYLHLLPERLHPRIQRMLSHQWLESCKDRERMKDTFSMLSRRASFENQIPEAMKPYEVHEAIMDNMFLSFFEDLRSYINLQNAG